MIKKISKILACVCICSVLSGVVVEAKTIAIKDKKVVVKNMCRAYRDPGDTDVSVPD